MGNSNYPLPAFKGFEKLEYGVIYVFSNLYAPKDLLNNYITIMGRATGQTEALNRFKVQVNYTDTPPMLVARRFNAGNIGHEAYLKCPVCGDISIDGKLVKEFVRRLFDFGQIDTGDYLIDINNFLRKREIRDMQQSIDNPDIYQKTEHARMLAQCEVENMSDDLHDAEGQDLAKAENERAQYLSIIGQLVLNYVSLTHSDPRQLIGNSLSGASPLIFAPQALSKLHIDTDLRIWLPQYKNAELTLHPLSKALYILFLRHPEGIELRNIDRHRSELEQIYDLVMPNRDIDTANNVIDNVLNPLTGTLQQNLSRIKRFVKTIIMDDKLAANYYITGRRGEAYSISLPRNLVSMPRIFDNIS